jgi:lysophospholipase L1-like esterase
MTRYLFIGDSVTDCGRRDDPDGLGFGYVRMLAEHPSLAGAEVINRGISGNRVVDLAARWQADVLDLRPDVVTVLIGINETWRRYDSADPTSTSDYERGYSELLATLDGPTLILMEPFVLPVTAEQESWHPDDLDEKIAVMHELAREFGAHLVPLDVALTARAVGETAAALADDGVHPTARGHELIADLWLDTARSAGLL